jgi:hypothetical protein
LPRGRPPKLLGEPLTAYRTADRVVRMFTVLVAGVVEQVGPFRLPPGDEAQVVEYRRVPGVRCRMPGVAVQETDVGPPQQVPVLIGDAHEVTGQHDAALTVLHDVAQRARGTRAVIDGEGNDRQFRQFEDQTGAQGPELDALGEVGEEPGRAGLPAFRTGVDGQRMWLVGSTVAQQVHRQPVELGEVVEVRVRQQNLVDDPDAVPCLQFQERWHHTHADVDERVADDLRASLADQRERDVRLPVGVDGTNLVGPRAVVAELDTEGWLNPVDAQKELTVRRTHVRVPWADGYSMASRLILAPPKDEIKIKPSSIPRPNWQQVASDGPDLNGDSLTQGSRTARPPARA